MFPFEKAQYQQSIPIGKGRFITVQLLEKATIRADPNALPRDLIYSERGASLYYDKYKLMMPSEDEDFLVANEERESSTSLYSDSRMNE